MSWEWLKCDTMASFGLWKRRTFVMMKGLTWEAMCSMATYRGTWLWKVLLLTSIATVRRSAYYKRMGRRLRTVRPATTGLEMRNGCKQHWHGSLFNRGDNHTELIVWYIKLMPCQWDIQCPTSLLSLFVLRGLYQERDHMRCTCKLMHFGSHHNRGTQAFVRELQLSFFPFRRHFAPRTGSPSHPKWAVGLFLQAWLYAGKGLIAGYHGWVHNSMPSPR